LEVKGAIHHVINRGNYRKDLFGEKGAAGRQGREVRELREAKGVFLSCGCPTQRQRPAKMMRQSPERGQSTAGRNRPHSATNVPLAGAATKLWDGVVNP